MGLLSDDVAELLEELEDLQQQTFRRQIDTTDYTCFASQATRGGKVESFGLGVDEDLVIITRGAQFDSPPETGETIVFSGRTYRIDRVLTAPGSCFLRLACTNAGRGA